MTVNRLLWLSFVLHLVTAVFSTGFHHWDEHFQILEFLSFKLGHSSSADLPWEFREQMRPFLQPFIYYLLVKPTLFLGGLFDPHHWAAIFRQMAALLGFYALVLLYSKRNFLIHRDYDDKTLLPLFLFTTWYLPYIHARHSAEGLGGTVFAIALAFFLESKVKKETWGKAALVGILFGISFVLRFHIGFMILFLYLWALLIDGMKWKRFFIHSSFIALGVLVFGVMVDSWGYGEWTFSPWAYVKQNLIEGKVSNFGVNPWYDYFKYTLRKSSPVIGFLTLVSFLWLWIFRFKHLLTWISLPFFLVHLLIGHKELRFLFPLINLVPFVWVIFLEQHKEKILEKIGPWGFSFFKLVWAVNFIYLFVMAFKPAHVSHDYYSVVRNHHISTLHIYGDTNPYHLAQLKINYFGAHQPKIKMLPDEADPMDIIKGHETWFFGNRGKFYFKLWDKKNCQLIYSNYPKWLLTFGGRPMLWQQRSKVWTLVKCTSS